MNSSSIATKRVVAEEVQSMFGAIAARYDITNTALSFGQHWLWRRTLRAAWCNLPPNTVALDLCTGTADVYLDLIKDFKHTVGVDFCLPMLVRGQEKIRQIEGNTGLGLVQGDGLKLPITDSKFDLAVISFGLRNFEDMKSGLIEIKRVLKPSGKLFILEFGQPPAGIWKMCYLAYSKYVMPNIGHIFSGSREPYEYLPATANAFPCRDGLSRELTDIGFTNCSWKSLSGGIAYLYSAEKG